MVGEHRAGDAVVRLSARTARPADRLDGRLGRARTAEPRQADRLWQARWRILISRSGGSRSRSCLMPKLWSPRQAGIRSRPTGGCFLILATDMRCERKDAWSALCAYDNGVFGSDRSQILARMRGRLPPANLLARHGGRIVGMLLGREGRIASHLGPLIADDDVTALALLRRALNGINGTVYIDIADAKGEARRWLEASGFAQPPP